MKYLMNLLNSIVFLSRPYKKFQITTKAVVISDCQKTFGRCRRGRSPSDFYSYPAALPTGRVVDFACKINSLQIRATSG